jgi:hypothetical protein
MDLLTFLLHRLGSFFLRHSENSVRRAAALRMLLEVDVLQRRSLLLRTVVGDKIGTSSCPQSFGRRLLPYCLIECFIESLERGLFYIETLFIGHLVNVIEVAKSS